MPLLFVYGSLRKGYGNHDLISHTEFIGNDSITAIDVSGPTTAAIIEGMGIVKGEVYDVPDFVMERVDDLEGIDFGLYIKKVVRSHKHRDVVVYFASNHLANVIAMSVARQAMMEDTWDEELSDAA